MKINSTQNINNLVNKHGNTDGSKKLSENKNLDQDLAKSLDPDLDAIFESSKTMDKVKVYDLFSLVKLSEESEDIYGKLEKMVEEVLREQKSVIDILKKLQGESLKNQGQDLVSSKGRLGAEAVSEKIASFVKDASGGEKAKIDVLIRAIDEAYREVEEALGQLPEISKESYKKIVEKLDKYIWTEVFENEPEKASLELKKMIKEILVDQHRSLEILKELPEAERVKLEQFIKEELVENPRERPASLAGNTSVTSLTQTLEEEALTLREVLVNEGLLGEDSLREGEALLKLARGPEREALARAILETGSLDIEAISEKIVEFVKKASQGDSLRFNLFRDEIAAAFRAREKALGGLSELSEKSYERIMEKLSLLERDPSFFSDPRLSILAGIMYNYRVFKSDVKVRIRTYIFTVLIGLTIYYVFKNWW